jgi:hypothetical protein
VESGSLARNRVSLVTAEFLHLPFFHFKFTQRVPTGTHEYPV